MRNLKRKAIVAVFALLMIAGAPAWAAFCSVSLSACGIMRCLPIPTGGHCTKNQTAEWGSMTVYNSSGAVVDSLFVYCPGSIVQIPSEP